MCCSATGGHCAFLELPEGLRNRIYAYTQEDKPLGLPNLSKTQAPHSEATCSKVNSRPSFLSLAQTCRLLRSEFRPIYMKSTVFCMSLLKTYAFIGAFVLPHGKNSHANIVTDFQYYLPVGEINLLGLLQHLRNFPNLDIRPMCGIDKSCEHDLNAILNVRPGPWFDNIVVAVSRVTLKPRENNLEIIFYVRSEYTEEWMMMAPRVFTTDTGPYKPWGLVRNFSENPEKKRCRDEWVQRMGLAFRKVLVQVNIDKK